MSTPNPPSFTIDDYRYAYYKGAVPPASGGGGGSSGPGGNGSGIVANSSQVANQYTTQANAGTQTAPAAFTVLATVTVANAGYYKVTTTYGYGGTAEGTTPDNFQLAVGSTLISTLPANISVNNTTFPSQTFNLKLNAGDIVRLEVGSVAGSTGSVYKGFITVDRLL